MITRVLLKAGLLVGIVSPAFMSGEARANGTTDFRTWQVYNGSNEALKYSALDQVNGDNVRQLAVAWTHRSGDVGSGQERAPGLTALQSNPMVIRGVMYLLGQNNKVLALDAATGRRQWVYQAKLSGTASRRGLAYWESPDRRERRVFLTVGPNLIAVDAASGTIVPGFGDKGVVTLYVDRDTTRTAGAPSPGIVFEDLLIMGSVVGEMYGGAPGNIRAYDVRTGQMRWVFRTVPHPGEFGYETWHPESYKRNGGANVWGAFSLDAQRGIVFAPTGSPSYDFYGADRPGQNLFGNCVLALDARTGKRLWHYQVVHHDLWDYDLSAQPVLASIPRRGKMVDAVIQVTKHGFVFVLDRLTGKPLFPVRERPVPKSDVPGERAWPTQPFPTLPAPVARQRMRLQDLTEFTDATEREALRKLFRSARNEGLFTPPSERGTIAIPGHNGGSLWGGGAYDPKTAMFYVSAHDQPSYFKLTRMAPRAPAGAGPLTRGRQLYRASCAPCHGPMGAGVTEVMAPLMPDAGAGRAPADLPDLGKLGEKLDVARFTTAVRDGKGRMPPSPQLSGDDISALAEYVRRIRTPEAQAPDAPPPAAAAPPADGTSVKQELRFSTPWTFFRDSAQLPAIKPPWGRLTAIDMKTGRTVWVKPVGDESLPGGQRSPPTGHKYLRGGPVVTAGGLVFMAGTQDRSLRAFDARTGDLLWTGTLPFDAIGMPAIYEVNGRQFIAVSATGDRGGNPGDAVVAFALP
jgi:quinoprotein glucose dehydrogenase